MLGDMDTCISKIIMPIECLVTFSKSASYLVVYTFVRPLAQIICGFVE